MNNLSILKLIQKLRIWQSRRARFLPIEAGSIRMDRADADRRKDRDAGTAKSQLLNQFQYVSKRHFFAGISGNIFEHYDTALFGLLAPFIAPLFFPKSSTLSALILTYGMFVFGFGIKPLGALVFGYLGDRYGRRLALSLSMIGVAVVTTMMGALPTYEQAGGLAPLLLAFCRILQGFFSAGERSGGAIFVLEKAKGEKSFLSSLYDVSSIFGGFLASMLVTLLCFKSETLWRIPFFLGGICGACGLILRLFTSKEIPEKAATSLKEHFNLVLSHFGFLFPIMLVSGFSYCTYTFSFTLMNAYLPLVTKMTKVQATGINTVLLLLDMALLPLFGLLAHRVTKERVMFWGATLAALLALPLFSLLGGASALCAIFVRIVIITCGVAVAAPYHYWALEEVPPHIRYTILSIGSALGTGIIGLPSTSVSLWLYKVTGWVAAPALYLIFFGGLVGGLFAFRMAKISSHQKRLRS